MTWVTACLWIVWIGLAIYLFVLDIKERGLKRRISEYRDE